MTGANDNRTAAERAGMVGLVAGGVEHGAVVTVRPGPRSCGSFRKVSASLTGAPLVTRPVLRLVNRGA